MEYWIWQHDPGPILPNMLLFSKRNCEMQIRVLASRYGVRLMDGWDGIIEEE